MSDRTKRTRNEAEAAFRKAQKAGRERDKSEAMKEYEARSEAIQEKSARLRALRLAKEAADAEAATATPKRKPRPKR